ncbi:multiple cyclophane-containing RiPP AmcA [Catelliglobosispora koreensis]|uniref:multiple cyclophane-containing RiPP AmcA n=1 Tax=Catelliglobosispora koreensis TaxID=129052 RepID=UPI0009FBEFD6|nr:multiple cyclophane-containing RiPP AmcA [Catelliglobosispora koreensis]
MPQHQDLLTARIRLARAELTPLLEEASAARTERAEVADANSSAVCAWNHFENIPTFFNWNNRPR